MSSTTYRVTVIFDDNTSEHLLFGDKASAWKTAQTKGEFDHVDYTLGYYEANGLFIPEKTASIYRGEVYFVGTVAERDEAFRANGEKCLIPGCEGTMYVGHFGSPRCKSGKRPHCTCDTCY